FLCESGQTTQLCVPSGAQSYLWSNGATTNCVTVSEAGIYSVTVTYPGGCSSVCSATVTVNPQPVCNITGNTVICQGQSTQLCVPAGAASYLWNTGATTNCITVSAAGIYSVTINSAAGCSSVCSTTVTVNPLPVCTISGNLSVCPGQTTQLCVLADAASYLWSNGETTDCISVNLAGNYFVTVTSAAGCSSVCSATVVINEQPVCNITGDVFLCAPGQTTQLCVPSGAQSYLWSNGATTNCVTVSEAGIYSVTVTYPGGCSSVCSATVIVNPQPVCNITGNTSICLGQSTQLCVPAGAASYLWNTGATTNCITVSTAGIYSVTVTYSSGCSSICSEAVSVTPQPACTITGDDFMCEVGQLTQLCVPAGTGSYLWSTGATTNCIIVSAPGTYFVTVTNQNGCSSICSKTIALQPPPDCLITGDDFICEEGQVTPICVTATGSATYVWNTGATTACISVGIGTYQVTVTYSNGCSSICSKTITLQALPVCNITCDDVICEGDVTQLCVPPGAASYLWSTGDTTHCITVGTAGTYSVTVTTAGGCSIICSKTITVVPVPVCGITGSCTLVCGGQPTLLCAPAGCAQYLWCTGATGNCIQVYTAGTYCVTITNANGCSTVCCVTVTGGTAPACDITGDCTLPCNGQPTLLCAPAGCANYLWSTGATTSCISVTTPGNYCVTVTNANGCSSVCSRIVTGGSVLNCDITGNCVLPCSGEPTLLCAPPGCASYWWNTGATTACIIVTTPGNYCVTVTNANGCSSVCSRIVTAGWATNCEITGNCTLPCSGEPTLLCAPAGCASYWWNTGATTPCIIVSTPGNYCVTVTNANGCSSVCSRIVDAGTVPDCHISGDSVLSCNGQPTLLCAPSGCISYLWNTGATTSCVIASEPGNYCVTVTYTNGCTASVCTVVSQEDIPVCSITGDTTLANGDPSLLCAPSGFAHYLWSTGDTTSCIIASLPGSYSVTVTNATGCSGVCSIDVDLFNLDTTESDSMVNEDGYLLVRAYPNPFSNTATLEFQNQEAGSHVVMEVVKLNGISMVTLFDGDVEKGKLYKVELDGTNLSEGVYVCRIVNGNQIINKKLVLIK
ncbi:MAG TPA: T9SS type A sorting domain-containing protein, partial [Saprospiraceae bacterium]|nr:T9SS type A sorting domain-containing protein [Saprospiraceae bacterium]